MVTHLKRIRLVLTNTLLLTTFWNSFSIELYYKIIYFYLHVFFICEELFSNITKSKAFFAKMY